MGIASRRIAARSATGLVAAAAVAFMFPGSAFADDAPDPVISGDCAATLQTQDGKARTVDENGNPLTIDLGAAVNMPGQLDVGLGSDSTRNTKSGEQDEARAAGEEDPLLSVPAADVAKQLEVGAAPGVGPLAKGGCGAAQDTVNALGATTQDLTDIGGGDSPQPDPPPAPEPEPQPEPEPEPEPEPQPEPEPEPGQPDPDQPDPGVPGDVDGGTGAGSPETANPAAPSSGQNPYRGGVNSGYLNDPNLGSYLSPNLNGAPMPTAPIAPSVPAPQAPGLDQPGPEGPPALADDSGKADAMPAASTSDQLPALLAVVALAIAVAALVRAWIRRKAV